MLLTIPIPPEENDPDWMEVPAPRRRAWEMLSHVTFGTYMLTCGCFGLVFLIGVFSFSADHKLNGEISTEIDEAEDWAKRANEVLNLQETFGCPMVCEMSVPCLPGIEKPVETTTPGRRLSLESDVSGSSAPARRLPPDVFDCPDGCAIPASWVNDNFCDCPEDCADEVDWTCETCGIANDENREAVDVGVGVGVGVGGALALGIGLGTGLGTGLGSGVGSSGSSAGSVAALAVLAATGSMRMRVENPSMVQNPKFADALKETIARLGGIGAAAVELIINCANARRLSTDVTERQLQQSVGICFQVQVEDSGAEELCQTLSGFDIGAVQSVLRSELLDAGIDPQEVTVTGYQASANPRSYSPLSESGGLDRSGIFVPPETVSLG